MREERRQQFRAELIARLQRVRGRMTDAEFDVLVNSVERTAARLAEIDAGPHAARLSSLLPPDSDSEPPASRRDHRP
jgi:hypothetical protein